MMRIYVTTKAPARTLSAASLATLAILTFGIVGCTKLNQIRANSDFKQANEAYRRQDYKQAAAGYESVLAKSPGLTVAYFYLGNSYDNMYQPNHKGEPANEALLDKAVKYYQLAADQLSASDKPDERKLGRLAMAYLVNVYSADKLNDPAKAEPIVQKLIQLEPGEPTNYFQLAKIYEDAGAYDEAEKVYLMAKNAKSNDPTVYTTLAGFYNRQGQFDKTIEALEERAAKEPNNPEAHHMIASYYWDEATRDPRLTDKQKAQYIQKGLQSDDRALQIRPDYVEALTFKGLLLRLQANVEKDPGKQQALIKQATELHDKAEDIRKKKAAGL
jgi:Tfp pilus assembly protein PilF